jgi:hypothetical protein
VGRKSAYRSEVDERFAGASVAPWRLLALLTAPPLDVDPPSKNHVSGMARATARTAAQAITIAEEFTFFMAAP